LLHLQSLNNIRIFFLGNKYFITSTSTSTSTKDSSTSTSITSTLHASTSISTSTSTKYNKTGYDSNSDILPLTRCVAGCTGLVVAQCGRESNY